MLDTPGRMLFLPPEKPAKKWVSIIPSLTRRSAFAAILLIKRGAAYGSVPMFAIASMS